MTRPDPDMQHSSVLWYATLGILITFVAIVVVHRADVGITANVTKVETLQAVTTTGVPNVIVTGQTGDITGVTEEISTSETFGGFTSMTGRQSVTQCDAGLLAAQTRIDNWNPGCLSTNALVTFQASDNSGTPVTGIDAVDNSLPVGSVLHLCNVVGPEDAAILQVQNMGRMPGSNTALSAAGNFVLTPGAGQGGRCSITTSTACHADANCPGGETCIMVLAPFTIGPNQCATLQYVTPWVSVGDATSKAWIIERTPRIDNVIAQALTLYPILYTDNYTGTVDDFNPTATFPTAGFGVSTFQCLPGNFTCGEAGDDLNQMNNSVIAVQTSTGLTVQGWHYDTQVKGPAGLGPVKVIINGGAGVVTLKNHSSATGVDNIETGANGDARGDVILQVNESAMLWHPRDTGAWIVVGKRDYWFHSLVTGTAGIQAQGYDTTQPLGATFLSTLEAINSATGIANAGVSSYTGLTRNDTGSYNTTATSTSVYGVYSRQAATRSAGANPLTQVAGYFSASSASASNFALQTDSGINQFNISSGYSSFVNDVFIGAAANCSKGAPTVNHGTLDSFSTNCYGRVTAIGANTSVTLTYVFTGAAGGAFSTTSRCLLQPESNQFIYVSTPSNATPVFSCLTAPGGTPANCGNFVYFCTGF